MILSGEAYSERLRTFTDSTMQLSIEIDETCPREVIEEASIIMADSELTEEEVVKRLLELKKMAEATR